MKGDLKKQTDQGLLRTLEVLELAFGASRMGVRMTGQETAQLSQIMEHARRRLEELLEANPPRFH